MNEFRFAVHAVLNNWSALQLALEHGMGGPRGREYAMQLIDEIVRNFYDTVNLECYHIADLLTDTMDTRFNTLCEDNSPDEVAAVIWNFFQYILTNNMPKFKTELGKLLNIKNQWYCSVPMPQPAPSLSLQGEDCVPSTSGNNNAGPSSGHFVAQSNVARRNYVNNGSDSSFLESSGSSIMPEESSTCNDSSMSLSSERELSIGSSISNEDDAWILVGGRKVKDKD